MQQRGRGHVALLFLLQAEVGGRVCIFEERALEGALEARHWSSLSRSGYWRFGSPLRAGQGDQRRRRAGRDQRKRRREERGQFDVAYRLGDWSGDRTAPSPLSVVSAGPVQPSFVFGPLVEKRKCCCHAVKTRGARKKSIHIWIMILSSNDSDGFTSFKINVLKQRFLILFFTLCSAHTLLSTVSRHRRARRSPRAPPAEGAPI